MKTLKELIIYQELTGEDDLHIIYEWFVQNNRESDGIAIIAQLAESRTKKLKERLAYAQTWLPSIPDVSSDDDVTKKYLHRIIRLGILDCDLTNHYYVYQWAKENIPKMKIPQVFFMPTLRYLQKYGIEFDMSEEERMDNIKCGFMEENPKKSEC